MKNVFIYQTLKMLNFMISKRIGVIAYSETPNPGPATPDQKNVWTNKFPDFCKNLHTITCVIQILDQQIPDVLVKKTVSRLFGV
jgi:hypothetical protein